MPLLLPATAAAIILRCCFSPEARVTMLSRCSMLLLSDADIIADV